MGLLPVSAPGGALGSGWEADSRGYGATEALWQGPDILWELPCLGPLVGG